jgi:aminopeptidase N
MKKHIFLFLIFLFPSILSAQIAPQKDFSDKTALLDKQTADAFLKVPLVYNGDNFDLKYHRFHWFIDPDTLFIRGDVTSYFTTTKASVDQLTFDFSSVMNIDSVKYHSLNITYSLTASNTLILYLPSALPLNQLDSVSVYYNGNPPQGSGFGSFNKDFHNGTPVIWTLSEPFGAKDWWPCKNDLSDKIDSIDVYVTTPQQYSSASNGMLLSEITQSSLKTAHWKHRYPIAAYLIAIAVTDYQSFSIYAHNGTDSIQILNYAFPEDLANAQLYSTDVVPSLELFDSLFITYPFVNERYGMTQFKWGGGMEHQTMTFLINFGFELMTHELAHQWVGDMITCGNWHDIWLNEGFATYWTGLSYQYLFDGYYWPFWKRYQIENITGQPDGSVYCTDTTSVSRIFDGRLSYAKGAMVLHMLRWTIGDSAFFAGFENYLNDPDRAFGYACSSDFITHMENASGISLTEFFNDWLYGEGYPIYTISCTFSATDNNVQVTIGQTQSSSSVSFFEMPVPLKFKDATHDTIIVFDNTFSGQQYTVDPGFRPDSIIFDPEQWIITANDTVMMNVNEYTDLTDISVYPNPVSYLLNIDISGMQIQFAGIYDIRGKLVLSSSHTNSKGILTIDMKDLSSGTYLLKAVIDNKVLIKKVTKL